MNIWMGGYEGKIDLSLNDMADPGPTQLIVFGDQREDQNGTVNLYSDMTGYPDKPQLAQFSYDFVPFYQGGATSYSFADGHSELKHWVDPRTKKPITKGRLDVPGIVSSPTNRDIVWTQEHATRRK